MDLLVLLLVIVMIGFLVYILTTQVPMPPGWARTIQIVALIIIIIYVFTQFVSLPNVLPRRR